MTNLRVSPKPKMSVMQSIVSMIKGLHLSVTYNSVELEVFY